MNFKFFVDVINIYIGLFVGFVMGWIYWLCWIIIGMVEVIVVVKYISFWFLDIFNWISVLFCVFILMFFNLLSVKLFGEFEFWFVIIKIVIIIVLIVIGVIMILFVFKILFGNISLIYLY